MMIPNLRPRFSQCLAVAVLAGTVALSSCAAFNKGQLVLARHVTIGQELLDLQKARSLGAITESEYLALKGTIMAMADSAEVIHVADFEIPVETSEH